MRGIGLSLLIASLVLPLRPAGAAPPGILLGPEIPFNQVAGPSFEIRRAAK